MTNPIAAVTASGLDAPSTSAQNTAAIQQAAREFEAILLREMLKTIKDCGNLGSSASSSGQAIYGSMVVETVANTVSRAGGLGMADLIGDLLNAQDRAAAPSLSQPPPAAKVP